MMTLPTFDPQWETRWQTAKEQLDKCAANGDLLSETFIAARSEMYSAFAAQFRTSRDYLSFHTSFLEPLPQSARDELEAVDVDVLSLEQARAHLMRVWDLAREPRPAKQIG